MRLHNPRETKTHRRALRRQGTPAEIRLWLLLKGRQCGGYRFRRQYGVGPYVLDFYCAEMRFAIELDGAVHHDPQRRVYDEIRQRYLENLGIRVLRLENRVVFGEAEGVRRFVLACMQRDRDVPFSG